MSDHDKDIWRMVNSSPWDGGTLPVRVVRGPRVRFAQSYPAGFGALEVWQPARIEFHCPALEVAGFDIRKLVN